MISSENVKALSQLVERAVSEHFSAVRGGFYPESVANSLM